MISCRNFVVIGVVIFSFSVPTLGQPTNKKITRYLKSILENKKLDTPFIIQNEPIYMPKLVKNFYEDREYRLTWVTSTKIKPIAIIMLNALKNSDQEGLIPNDYHHRTILALQEKLLKGFDSKTPLSIRRLIHFDLLITDGFFMYATHLLQGRLNPLTYNPNYKQDLTVFDLALQLQSSLDDNRLEDLLSFLPPQSDDYKALKNKYILYRSILKKGGWPTISKGRILRRGVTDPRVAQLKSRLAASEEYEVTPHPNIDYFDRHLAWALKRYQMDHGLTAHGKLDAPTVQSLNTPVTERMKTLMVNMERWRWIPRDLGRRYIVVNIARYELTYWSYGQQKAKMKVVVGKPYRQTPLFSAPMTYLVLNPYWSIPWRISVSDILPHVLEDPSFLKHRGIRVFKPVNDDFKEIDPETIKWHRLSRRGFPYLLRQNPGPQNAMGTIKFVLPNPHNIYLHGTPSYGLFNERNRAFSSGCIRLENPLLLAREILRDSPNWNRSRLIQTIRSRKTRTITIQEPVQVHLQYWTAVKSHYNQVNFLKDIYGRDEKLFSGLIKPIQ